MRWDLLSAVRSFVAATAVLVITAIALFVCLEVLARAVYRAPRGVVLTTDPMQVVRTPRIPLKYPAGKRASIASEVIPAHIDREYASDAADQLAPFPFTWLQAIGNYQSPVIHSNRNGFRAPNIEDILADQRAKILLLGGSGMWGAGASSDSTTIGGQLQAMIDRNGLAFQVVNLAQPGFQTLQELITFVRVGLVLRPRIVVVMDGGNDINHAMFQEAVGDPACWAETVTVLDNARRSPLTLLARSSRMVQLAMRNSVLNWSETDAGSSGRTTLVPAAAEEEIRRQIVDQFERNLDSLFTIAGSKQIAILHILQPTVHTVEPHNALEATLGTPEFFAMTYDELLAAQHRLAQAHHIPAVDGGQVFAGDRSGKTRIVDEFHYTDYGNSLIAGWIFAQVGPLANPLAR